MAATPDGFDYALNIGGNFESQIAKYVEAWAKAKAAVKDFSDGTANIRTTLASAAKNANDASKSTDAFIQSAGKGKPKLDELAQANLNVERALRKKSIAEKETQIIEERGLDSLKKKKTVLTDQDKAIRSIEEDLAKLNRAGLKQKIIDEEGITALQRKAKAFDAEAAAAERALKADQKLQTLAATTRLGLTPEVQGPPRPPESELQGPVEDEIKRQVRLKRAAAEAREQIRLELAELQQGPPRAPESEVQGPPEDEVARRVRKLVEARRELLAVQEQLKAQGFDATGAPAVQGPPEEEISGRARRIAETKQKQLDIEKQLRDIGLDARGNRILSEKERIEEQITKTLERRRIQEAVSSRTAPSLQQRAQTSVAAEIDRLNLEKVTRQIQAANPELQRLREEMNQTEGAANRIAFTFRRLIGIFAAFTAVRLFVGALRDGVRASIDFNAQIQTSVIGIASLIQATGQVTDPMGRATTQARAFGFAQAEAAKQVALLRKENLRTAATFDELVRAFQSGVAPGLTSGLMLDEIREFTVLISKAATAIGLPQEQLPEEIRSILQGTIQARTTRIATSLGITNEDIRKAKEMGVLFEFLEKRFSAFNLASEAGLKTFAVRLSNARDALKSLFAAGLETFFNKLSDLLEFVQKKLIDVSDAASLKINPAAVQAIELLGSILAFAVDEAKRLVEALDLGVVEGSFQSFAILAKTVIGLVGALVEGLIRGAGVIGKLLAPFLRIAETLVDLIGPQLRAVIVYLVAAVVAVKSLDILFFSIPTSIATMVRGLLRVLSLSTAFQAQMYGAAVRVAFINTGLLATVATLGVITAGLIAIPVIFNAIKERQEELTGQQLTWGQSLTANIILIQKIGPLIGTFFSELGSRLLLSFEFIVLKIARFIVDTLGLAITTTLKAVAFFIPGLSTALDELEERIKTIDALFDSSLAAKEDAFNKLDPAKNFVDGVRAARDESLNLVKTLDKVDETGLVKAVAGMPAIVGNTTKGMEELVQKTTDLREELIGANETLKANAAALGAQGAILQQVKDIADARTKVEANQRKIVSERTQAEKALTDAKGEQIALEQKLAGFQAAYKDKALQSLSAVKQILAAQNEVAEKETQVALAKASVGKADTPENRSKLLEANAGLAAAEQQLNTIKKLANLISADLPKNIQDEINSLATQLVSAKGKQVDAQRRINDALREQSKLEKAVFDIAEAKIALTGLQEFEEIQKRIRQAKVEVAAAERLAPATRSRLPADEQLATSRNEVETNRANLESLTLQNEQQQKALRFVIDHIKNVQLRNALERLLVKTKEDQTLQERLLALAVEGSLDKTDKLTDQIQESHEASQRALHQEIIEGRILVEGQERLIKAKRTASEFDDRVVGAQNDIAAQKAKLEATKEQIKQSLILKGLDLQKASDPQLRANLEEEIFLLRQKGIIDLAKQAVILTAMKAELEAIVRSEFTLASLRAADSLRTARTTRIDTVARETQFRASQGISRDAVDFANAVGAAAVEQDKLVLLQKQHAASEARAREELRIKKDILSQVAAFGELLSLQEQNSSELAGQQQALEEALITLNKIVARMERPVREGLFEGMRQFINEAPTLFDLSVDVMKSSLQGLAKVGADSVTAIFDPQNTTTIAERLGQLALSIANKIFQGLFEQGISALLQGVFPELTSGSGLLTASAALNASAVAWQSVVAGLLAAAAALTTASGVQAGASAVGLASDFGGAAEGGLWSFAGGGTGSRKRDPRDTQLGWFRPGEFTLVPEAVQALGLNLLNDLNGLRPGTPQRAPNVSRGSPAAASSSRAASPPPRAYLVASEQMAEQLLASGSNAFHTWLQQNGYAPKFVT